MGCPDTQILPWLSNPALLHSGLALPRLCPLPKSRTRRLVPLTSASILGEKQLCVWMGKINLEGFQLDLLICGKG